MLLDNRKTQVIEVEVTQEDIAMGERSAAFSCALALALMRTVGGEWIVTNELAARAGAHGLYHHDGADFVNTFDAGGEVFPTVVRLTSEAA